MRAVAIERFGGLGELKLLNLPVPEPGVGEVRVRVLAAGVNPVDVLLREGHFADRLRYPFPVVMGTDLAGVVDAVGPGVTGLSSGDRVFAHKPGGNGTYAEYAVLAARAVAPMPRTLGFEAAAAVPCVGLTAYQAMTEALVIRPGQTVLVAGAAGGVGCFAVQFAKQLGAVVIATASGANHDFVRGLGADHVIDYSAEDFVAAARRVVPGGVDAAFSTVSGETKRLAVEAVRDGGRYIWISSEEPDGPPLDRGITGRFFFPKSERGSLETIAALIDCGAVSVPLTKVMPLEDARSAQEAIASGRTRGKIVITVT